MPRKAYMGLFRIWQSPVDRFLPYKPDAVWYPDFVAAPWIRGGKKVLTVHDLTFIHDVEVVERKNLRYLRRFVPQSISRVDVLTTVSETVKKDIAASLKPNIPISVIYPVAPAEKAGTPDIRNPYILFVGTLQPRKNIKTLLKAYMLLPAKLRTAYRLILAGRRGWNDAETMELMQKTPLTWVDGPTTPELNKLYDHASLFVLPSTREGFGIPPIESLARHVPVITSEDPALIEATGKAALHVPADSPQKLADAMQQLLTDSTLRNSLAAHRSAQLKKFDAAHSAQLLIDLLVK